MSGIVTMSVVLSFPAVELRVRDGSVFGNHCSFVVRDDHRRRRIGGAHQAEVVGRWDVGGVYGVRHGGVVDVNARIVARRDVPVLPRLNRH